MVQMNKQIQIEGKQHKIWMLENSIDKENKCRISVRALNDSGVGLEINWKNILSNWNYYSRKYNKLKVLENDDRQLEPCDDMSIWLWGIQQGYWDENKIPFSVFSNKVEKKTAVNEPTNKEIIKEMFESRGLYFNENDNTDDQKYFYNMYKYDWDKDYEKTKRIIIKRRVDKNGK